MITKAQIIKIKIQLKQLGLDSKFMADSYSNGRTEHISQLKFSEAWEMSSYLSEQLNEPDSPKEKMCRKIISMAHEQGWKLRSGKINMQRVNNWCIKYGIGHKPLKDYYEYELPALVTQFENMYGKHLNKV